MAKIADIKAAFSKMENGELTYHITGFMFTDLFDHFVDTVNFLEPTSIRIILFSPGGTVLTAFALYDYIRTQIKVPVTAEAFGYCASAATIVAAAADKTRVAPNAYWLIHPAFNDFSETEEDEKTTADITDRMVSIYVEKTGQSAEWLRAEMEKGDKGKFLSAEDALEFGFADEIIEKAAAIAASKNIFGFNNNNKMQTNKFVDKLLGILGIEKIDDLKDTPETMALLKEKLSEGQEDKNSKLFAEFKASLEQRDVEKDAEIEALNSEIEAVNAKTEEIKGQIEAEKEQYKALNSELDAIKASVAKMVTAAVSATGDAVDTNNVDALTSEEAKDKNKKVAKSDVMATWLNGNIV